MSPLAALRACLEPRCPNLIRPPQRRCPQHATAYDLRRGSSRARGYDHRWAKASRAFRQRFPLCGMKADGNVDRENSWCARDGLTVAAECVQHIVPHGGPTDPLFYAESNWMSSCLRCNNRRRAIEPGAFGR